MRRIRFRCEELATFSQCSLKMGWHDIRVRKEEISNEIRRCYLFLGTPPISFCLPSKSTYDTNAMSISFRAIKGSVQEKPSLLDICRSPTPLDELFTIV